ncbi:MAG TPA: hypothetical protein VIM32_00730 [Desulfosporosinus sp.]
MAVQNSVVYQSWSRRITLATTFIVVVLSWLNEVRIPDLIIRGVISYGVMYFLMAGILSLFENTASQEPKNSLKSSTADSLKEAGRGGVIDFSVGDEEPKPQTQPENYPGQVDPNLRKGLPGSQQQAEIVRRMGWDDEHK